MMEKTRIWIVEVGIRNRLKNVVTAKGERLVRFSYSGPGGGVRGPVTLRARDIGRLKEKLAKHPQLAETLGM